MTANQWKMLDILEDFGGLGTCEVECQWGGYDFGDTDAAQLKALLVTRLVCGSIVRSLVKKGYATNEDSYDITAAGLAALARHRERAAKGAKR